MAIGFPVLITLILRSVENYERISWGLHERSRSVARCDGGISHPNRGLLLINQYYLAIPVMATLYIDSFYWNCVHTYLLTIKIDGGSTEATFFPKGFASRQIKKEIKYRLSPFPRWKLWSIDVCCWQLCLWLWYSMVIAAEMVALVDSYKYIN